MPTCPTTSCMHCPTIILLSLLQHRLKEGRTQASDGRIQRPQQLDDALRREAATFHGHKDGKRAARTPSCCLNFSSLVFCVFCVPCVHVGSCIESSRRKYGRLILLLRSSSSSTSTFRHLCCQYFMLPAGAPRSHASRHHLQLSSATNLPPRKAIAEDCRREACCFVALNEGVATPCTVDHYSSPPSCRVLGVPESLMCLITLKRRQGEVLIPLRRRSLKRCRCYWVKPC